VPRDDPQLMAVLEESGKGPGAGEKLSAIAHSDGLSPEAAQKIRGILLGIDPLPVTHV